MYLLTEYNQWVVVYNEFEVYSILIRLLRFIYYSQAQAMVQPHNKITPGEANYSLIQGKSYHQLTNGAPTFAIFILLVVASNWSKSNFVVPLQRSLLLRNRFVVGNLWLPFVSSRWFYRYPGLVSGDPEGINHILQPKISLAPSKHT